MKEKAKSVLLAVLVLLSLLQSYFLAYNFPNFSITNQPESGYIRTDLQGTEETAENLLQPDEMILHFGLDKHTVLYPETEFYNLIFQRLKGRTFDGFQRLSILTVDWSEIRKTFKGVEIRFNKGIPMNLLARMMQIQGDTALESDTINRIWIYMKENKEEVRTLFVNDTGSAIYESTKADLTVKDVEEFVGFGEFKTPYATEYGEYYLPSEPLKIVKYRIPYDQFTSDQMQRSLFPDPGITRNLPEKDGSVIYTDSKRGLRVINKSKWITYTDPIAPVDSSNNVLENLYASVQFVNRHGGWNGKYILHETGGSEADGNNRFMFQQYYGPYPIISDEGASFGYMRLTAQKGVVSAYERSLINLDKPVTEKTQLELPGGKELQDRLLNRKLPSPVRDLYPAYVPTITEKYVELRPVWAVETADGERHIL
ncbi:YycH family regulatory protein [Paenibacillus gansuensis]|uniref:YycH family regulatory protein n=1 Tax=Paenibacillus gansuensis TaxID=306542 RepID=A0ABW5PJC9_9BACL